MLPVSLVILSIIALALHIIFTYYVTPPNPPNYWMRPIIATVVIIIVLLLWYVIPVQVGRG